MPFNLCTCLTNTSQTPRPFRASLQSFHAHCSTVAMELQADLLLPVRPQHVGLSLEQHQHRENSPPFLAGRSALPFSTLHFVKRRPLQDITHLFATNAQSIHNGRRMVSVTEIRAPVEPIASVQNKKRKATNLSIDSNTRIPNLKKPLLRRDFR